MIRSKIISLLQLLILFAFQMDAQDTLSYACPKNSFSVGCDMNIVYPVTKHLNYRNDNGPNYYWSPFWNFTFSPSSSVEPCFSLRYNYAFHKTRHFNFILNAGFSYLKYSYKMNATGYYCSYFGKSDTGSFNAQANISAFEGNVGVSMNLVVSRKLMWRNELEYIQGFYNTSFPSFSTDAPSPVPFNDIINPDGVYYYSGRYSYLFYQTGIDIKVSKKIILTPEISIPLLNVLFFTQTKEPYAYSLPVVPFGSIGNQPIYSTVRIGVTITYNLDHK